MYILITHSNGTLWARTMCWKQWNGMFLSTYVYTTILVDYTLGGSAICNAWGGADLKEEA